MRDQEFKSQNFRTPDQWKSGLYYRLRMPEGGGVALAAMPAESRWLDRDGVDAPACLATDECGQLYFIGSKDCRLYRYEQDFKRKEPIPLFGGRGSDPGQFISPTRMIIGRHTLWVVDQGTSPDFRVEEFKDGYTIKALCDRLRGDGFVLAKDTVEELNKLLEQSNTYSTIEHKIAAPSEKLKILEASYEKEKNADNLTLLIRIALEECYPHETPKSHKGNGRIQAFARENLQIKYIINGIAKPLDMAVSGDDRIFVLDHASRQIHLYDVHGQNLNKQFGGDRLKEPVCCAAGKDGVLFVIDRQYDAFLRFGKDGEYLGTAGDFTKVKDFTKVVAGFKPSVICIDNKGNIYVGGADVDGVHEFASDGSYLGKVPGFTGSVVALAVDHKGDVYVYADGAKGIALLSADQRYSQQEGIYYSKTLDSGIEQCQWHRLALQSELHPETVLKIYYYLSDDGALRSTIDGILSNQALSTDQKKEAIDARIPEKAWIGPADHPVDMLFREKTGRYLWLKLVLFSLDDRVTPSIAGMRVFYPRTSYLRYLPAIYQEDPVRREFLERFLSLFESLFFDLETEISRLANFFDPSVDICNVFEHFNRDELPGFLAWLASWLNVALEEEWPDQKKRRLISNAYSLYKQKGTPTGIRRLIEICTGKSPIIIDHAKSGGPMVLGQEFRMGVNSILMQTPVRGFRLGDDSILGRVALRDEAYSPDDPFLPLAHRFTVVVDMSSEEFIRYEKGLRRILDEEKPAHTVYTLRAAGEMRVGLNSYVGINSRVADYRPITLGRDSILGKGLIAFDTGEQAGKVERRSKLGVDTRLI